MSIIDKKSWRIYRASIECENQQWLLYITSLKVRQIGFQQDGKRIINKPSAKSVLDIHLHFIAMKEENNMQTVHISLMVKPANFGLNP